ncbi:MAG TPA: acetamidase/formamidase family protein [Victivallales bacterium]|nr:acetamidase/formamidase family protein [Victivallales bacterium]
MTRHILKSNIHTVHKGRFSPLFKPALNIVSGDIVDIETYAGYINFSDIPEAILTEDLVNIYKKLPYERKLGDGSHLLTGPIYIEDAEPGDLIEIRLIKIEPSEPIGYNLILPGTGSLPEEFDYNKLLLIPIDLEQNSVEFPEKSNIRIPLSPFFGIIGVATEDTNQSAIPPGKHGGNMDNKELIEGTRVFIPVQVSGGLLSIGDGHSIQGDGEVNAFALETSMNGTVQIILHKSMLNFDSPFAETDTHWITMGFENTLDDAFKKALLHMLELLTTFYPLTKEEAYRLCSLTADFRITQAVNLPNKGVHGMIPKSIFSSLPATNKLIQEWKI